MKIPSHARKWIPIPIFVLVSILYVSPILKGEHIFQSDILQYIGMSKQQKDFRKASGTETYWTDSAFGGMPTYQLGAAYPYDFIGKIDRLIRFLPRPADYLFLYFIGFYILMLSLKADYRLATLGALGFGLSTYLIIIIDVGHNSKAHAIGYFAPALAAFLATLDGKRLTGSLLLALALALEIHANHYQMTYYLLLLMGLIWVIKAAQAFKDKRSIPFLKNTGTIAAATALALMLNATALMSTMEYVKWSTRGKSELVLTPEGAPKKDRPGLDKAYITQYSYGIFESLNLFVPRLLGGSNGEDVGTDSETYKMLTSNGVPGPQARDFVSSMPTYWGDQPIVAAPAYVGAVLVFLFVLALFLVKGLTKKWLMAGIVMALMLSWGKNFSFLTNFMIDYFPMYNRFRAVSSIQTILELCLPILAVLGLQQFLSANASERDKAKALKFASGICLGVLIVLFLIKGTLDFRSASDAAYQRYFGDEVMRAIRADRRSLYTSDLWRSLILLLICIGALWGHFKRKLGFGAAVSIIFALVLFDLWAVDKRYLNSDSFSSRPQQMAFEPTAIDLKIKKDTARYRVWNMDEGLNGAKTSYFHNSIGGYHAAKPRRMQEIFDYLLSKNRFAVLDLLNVKYVIQNDTLRVNPTANGAAWFVKRLQVVPTADLELAALDTLRSKETAVVSAQRKAAGATLAFAKDSTAQITLKSSRPNELIYESKNPKEGLAVFSEAYYPHGWQATIDGAPTDILKVDYSLRGLYVPSGAHQIRFWFEPKVVETGSRIALAGFILLALASASVGLVTYKKSRKP